MKSNMKKLMLAGTAIVAVSAFSAQAQAVDLAGDSTYGTTVPVDAPTAGINVDLKGSNLTINNTSNVAIGAVTDTGTPADGNVTVTTSAAADLAQTIGSIQTGTGNVALTGVDANNANIAVTVSGNSTIGGTLALTTTEATAAHTVTLTNTGNLAVTGTTTVTAGGFAGANTVLNVDGATNTFTGAVAVNGGGAANANASIVLSGANTTFTNGLTLTNNTGAASLVADGTVAQTVNGNIAGDGAINVANATGVTFNGTVGAGAGTIVLENGGAALNSAATFRNTVNVASITLGGAGTGTNAVTFDTTTQAFTVTGTVDGAIAGETNNVSVIGGKTLTQGTAWGGVTGTIDNVNVTGTGTVLDSNFAITAGTITIGNGATLDAAAVLTAATGGIVNNGTLKLTNAGVTHVANVTGTGLLDVDANTTINGSITQGSADIAAVTLTQGAVGYNVGTTNFSADGTLALINGNQTVAGNFTNTTDAHGTITIADGAGTTAFTGNVGASEAHSLKALTFATAATAQAATFTGNLFVDTITTDGGDTVQFIGTNAQTVSGNFVGVADDDGIILVGNGTNATDVTFNGEIGDFSGGGVARNRIADVTVDGKAKATFTKGVELGGNLVVGDAADAATANFLKGILVAGTSSLNGDVLLGNHNATTANTFTGAVTAGAEKATTIVLAGHSDIDGGLTIGNDANDTVTFLIKKTETFNPIDADGNGTVNQVTDVILDATGTAVTRTGKMVVGLSDDSIEIDNGSQIHVITSNAATYNTGLTDGTIKLQDTAFVSLVDNGSTTTDLRIRLENKEASSVIGADQLGVNAANTLLNISNADTSNQLEIAKANLQNTPSKEKATEIANSLAPNVDAGAVIGAQNVANQTSRITHTQLASLRDGTETGMFAGNVTNGLRGWIQGFGLTGTQDQRDGVAGYDVDTYGFAVGLDTQSLAEKWVWGLAFAYGDTDVDSKGVNSTDTQIDSYQVSLYGNYDIDDRTYVAGQVGYIWADNDQTRHNIAGAGFTADANYDSDVIFANLEAGRNYAVGGNTKLTPKALINYQHYSADGYTESGTVGNAGLVVGSENLDLFEIGVGVDASWDLQQADGSYLQPKIGVGVRHDLIGDEYETTSRFIGAGSSFQTKGFDPAQTTFNVSADVTYFSTTNWELSAGYDFEVKSDYDSHAGTVRAAYKF